jgi:hypothetical protein
MIIMQKRFSPATQLSSKPGKFGNLKKNLSSLRTSVFKCVIIWWMILVEVEGRYPVCGHRQQQGGAPPSRRIVVDDQEAAIS